MIMIVVQFQELCKMKGPTIFIGHDGVCISKYKLRSYWSSITARKLPNRSPAVPPRVGSGVPHRNFSTTKARSGHRATYLRQITISAGVYAQGLHFYGTWAFRSSKGTHFLHGATDPPSPVMPFSTVLLIRTRSFTPPHLQSLWYLMRAWVYPS